jgi:hypothetical protein
MEKTIIDLYIKITARFKRFEKILAIFTFFIFDPLYDFLTLSPVKNHILFFREKFDSSCSKE